MPNAYANKVQVTRGGQTETLIDLTADTAIASDVAQGKYFHLASGERVVGTATGGTGGGGVYQDQDGYIVLSDQGGGSSVTVEALNVTQNGTYTAPTGKAYSPVTVNVSGGGGGSLKMGVLRPDAELVRSWTYDKYIVADENVQIPAYSTSGVTLKASETTVQSDLTLDFDTYVYYVVYRYLAAPSYSTAENGRGRLEYTFSTSSWESFVVPANTFAAHDGTKYGSSSVTYVTNGTVNRIAYWTSASSFYVQTNSSYGAYLSGSSPFQINASTGIVSFTAPALMMRGQASYLSQTYWELITDIRYQYIVELYRSEKGAANIDGWALFSQGTHVIDCAQSASGKLT